MAEEGGGGVFNGEHTLFGGGRGRGRGEGGRGEEGGRGRGKREMGRSFGFPIVDEETNVTMKNISPMLSPKDVLFFHQISLHFLCPLSIIGLKDQ